MAYGKKVRRSAYIKLLPSVLCIAVTLFAGIAAATAWFSINSEVNAKGLTVSLNTKDAYLVIAKSLQDLYKADSTNVSVSYGVASHAYVPVTHDDNSNPYLLKYTSSGDGIDPDTGLADSLSFNAVPYANQNDVYYFADFEVYIGALHCELIDNDLIADWDEDSLPQSATDRQKAASIDFYVKQNGSFTYVTSTNLATCQSVTLLSDTVIPYNKSGNGINVLMRFYFDGGLTYEDDDGEEIAYIRTSDVVSSNVSLGISFRAEPHGTQ